MSKLLYIINTSLDGYVEDASGSLDWTTVSDQVFDAITELVRPVGTHLYGRRLYESMAYWGGPVDGYPPEHRDFARIWQKTEKVVFSRALTSAATGNTRVERNFDPDVVRALKLESGRDISVGGPELAALAFEAGLVDECHLLVHPVVVGGGKPAFRAGLRLNLELLETDSFGTGVVQAHYRVRGDTSATAT